VTVEVRPGPVVLFGSGETAGVGREALRWLHARGPALRSVVVLDTPAGFEPNGDAVARRWTDFIARQPEAKDADTLQLPVSKRGTVHSPDDPTVAHPILAADLIALGAGSPTYTVRQLRESVAWENVRAAHQAGATLFLASASAIAAGTFALPVYEIYKAGEELHWVEGLGLLEPYGLSLAVVTHWDNADGGAELDTSRCFMGEARFESLRALLPVDAVVLGIDEHTALALDPAAGAFVVLGLGGVTVLRGSTTLRHSSGSAFPLAALGRHVRVPLNATGIAPEAARAVVVARAARDAPPSEIAALIASRERARHAHEWERADGLRQEIEERGWAIDDEPAGPHAHRIAR
jgi:hypothetical protein